MFYTKLILTSFFLFSTITCFCQTRKFCDYNQRIDAATDLDEVSDELQSYLFGVLGNSDGFNTTVIPYNGYIEYESPFGGYDAAGMRYKIYKKVRYSFQTRLFNYPREISEAKFMAKEVIEFFTGICEIKNEDNPNVRYFKILNKVLYYTNEYGALGPYSFIIDIIKVYVDVSAKAIKFIEGWLTSTISDAYFDTGGSNLVIRLFIKKLKDIESFNKVTSYSLVANNEYIPDIELESSVGKYSNYGTCITITIPGQTMQSPNEYALKLKIGGLKNVVMLPINKKMPFKKEGPVNYLVELIKKSGSTPETTILVLE